MNATKFENLNKTPVRTKEWLGINDITLKDYKSPEIKEFKGGSVIAPAGVNIRNIKEVNENLELPRLVYSAGEELLNEADTKFNDGYVIILEKDLHLSEPIVIEYNLDEINSTLVDKLSIIAEENSNAKIIVKYKSYGNSEGYHNGVCRVLAKDNSNVQVVKVNLLNEKTVHFDSNVSEVKSKAKAEFVSIDFGARYSIANYHGDLTGENGEATLDSIYLGDNEKVIDINYIMTHIGKFTKSNIVTNGALKDSSKKTFRGTIDFKRGASKSIGAEREYSIMLSKKAKSKALPVLLCEEDDVSGEHSASSGSIDEAKLFYLMSRGFSYEEAVKVIVQAAFNPIIDKITEESIRNEVIEELDRRLING